MPKLHTMICTGIQDKYKENKCGMEIMGGFIGEIDDEGYLRDDCFTHQVEGCFRIDCSYGHQVTLMKWI